MPHDIGRFRIPDVTCMTRGIHQRGPELPLDFALVNAVKEVIRSGLRRLGLDVRGYSFSTSPDDQFRLMFAQHGIDLVLDIGANTGQSSQDLRSRLGYRGRIVSFEPLPAAHEQLVQAAASDPLWEVAPRVAIGSSAGSVTLHVAGNSQSSSVLPMLESHAAAAPQSRYVKDEVVPMATLDVAARDYIREGSRVFLKIDTQGYEAEVLRGAPAMLARAVGVQMEMSLLPLYEAQPLMRDLWRMLEDAGFELWTLSPVFVDSRTGRLLQVDAVFFRKSPAAA
jgi:FkbM family methyltransferase